MKSFAPAMLVMLFLSACGGGGAGPSPSPGRVESVYEDAHIKVTTKLKPNAKVAIENYELGVKFAVDELEAK